MDSSTSDVAARAVRRIEELWKLQLGAQYWESDARVEHEIAIIRDELVEERTEAVLRIDCGVIPEEDT
jgi:hypothetical protein